MLVRMQQCEHVVRDVRCKRPARREVVYLGEAYRCCDVHLEAFLAECGEGAKVRFWPSEGA